MKLLFFSLINFTALGLGGILLGNPKANTWYQLLNKAPWTPPNWVFGAAWASIMICFSVFLWLVAKKYSNEELKVFYVLYAVQFVLNVMWNPVFFRWHMVATGLIIIIALTLLVGWFTVWGFNNTGPAGVLMLPYFVWLIIATSLNAYVLIKN